MKTEENEANEESPEASAEALERDLARQKKLNEELLTRIKYAQADLENYRKRMDKELREAGETLAKSLVVKLLVVQDELDLAVKHAQNGPDIEVKEGLAMIGRNLQSALESVGVERIEAVGKPFDPSIHEAVERIQGNSPELDVVVDEVRPGFTFRGQLLRPSMVKVELASKTAREAKASE